MFIHGNLATAMAAQAGGEDAQGLVPSSWELVRRNPGGHTETVAKHVLTFDVAGDGRILYSDGASIFQVNREGRHERILQAELIERVLAL